MLRYLISSREREEREEQRSREKVELYSFSFLFFPTKSNQQTNRPMMPPASLLLFFTLCGLAVSARPLILHHRLFVPSVSDDGTPPVLLPPWVPRATAEILTERIARYSPAATLDHDLVAYRSVAGSTQPSALYQVALELPGVPPNLWPFSSVKAVCCCVTPRSHVPVARASSDSSCSSSATSPTTPSTRYGSMPEETQNIRHTQ